jgi:hypothetical protein
MGNNPRRWIMKSTSRTLLVVLVALVCLLAGGMPTTAQAPVAVTLATDAAPLAPHAAPVQYSAPYICGWLPSVVPQEDKHAKPGDYATAINIHNPTLSNVAGSARVAVFYPPGGAAPPVFPAFAFTVYRFRVLEIDCVEIWRSLELPPGTFTKGAVHIGLQIELPMAGIYTSQTHPDPAGGPDPGAGISIDLETITPFLFGPAG